MARGYLPRADGRFQWQAQRYACASVTGAIDGRGIEARAVWLLDGQIDPVASLEALAIAAFQGDGQGRCHAALKPGRRVQLKGGGCVAIDGKHRGAAGVKLQPQVQTTIWGAMWVQAAAGAKVVDRSIGRFP